MTFDTNHIVLLTGGIVALVCAVLIVKRAFTKFSSASVREDLTVSRSWLLEHQVRKDGD